MLPSIVCEIIRRINKGIIKEEAEYSPFLYVLPYYFAALCSSRFLIMGRMIPSAVSTQGVMILRHIVNGSVSYTPSEQAARSGYEEAPAAGRERKCIILHKAILGIEFVSGFAERDICGEYPQVTHGHAD